MAAVIGLNCRTYYNSSSPYSAGTPEWTLVNEVTSVNVDGSTATADVSRRGGGGYRQKVPTLAEGTVSFDLIYDDTDNTFFDLIDATYRARGVIDLWFVNGAIGTVDGSNVVTSSDTSSDGVRGFRANFSVTNFSESQDLEDANRYTVTLDVQSNTPTPGYWAKAGGASATYALVS